MLDSTSARAALKTNEESLSVGFVRRGVNDVQAEKCDDGECFVDWWDPLQISGRTVGPNIEPVE
jgi:hypothetical protein